MKHKYLSIAVSAFLILSFSNHSSSAKQVTQTAPEKKPSIQEHRRIISAGGSITEVLYALGLQDNLVGVDSTSLYPQQTQDLPKVGYFRSLAAEGLMSLNPSLIVAAKGAGPDIVLEQVRRLGVEVRTYEQSVYTLESWKELIWGLGRDFNRTEEANELVRKTTRSLNGLANANISENKPINAVTLLSIGQRGPVAAGSNTVPNFLFELTNVNNAAASIEGYKPFSSELLAKQKLDLVFIPSHVIASLGGKEAVCNNQFLKLAMPDNCNVVVMDGLLLMGFGSRIDQAATEVAYQASQLSR